MPRAAPAVRRLPGADAVLAAHAGALPQPDQLCGPFSARCALHAVLDPGSVPGVVDLAVAAGTRVRPGDDPALRPPGAALVRTGWDVLSTTTDPAVSGTDAAGLARGVEACCPAVAVVPAAGLGAPDDAAALVALLDRLVERGRAVGVLANVRTGAIRPPGEGWDVGHVVVLWGLGEGDGGGDIDVAVADTYPELGAAGWPPGCRGVAAGALATALADRGLLLLADAGERSALEGLVQEAGLVTRAWST